MFNLIRKFLRPTLREQLEAGVRDALRKYADRRAAPDLRVYVSTDLLPEGVEPTLWSQDEAGHLRRFAVQWAEDNHIARAGLRLEVVLLDTKREFAFVKPAGLEPNPREPKPARPLAAASPSDAPRAGGEASLEVVESPTLQEPLQIRGEVTLGRRSESGVQGIGDRYMSARHARLRLDNGRLWVTDLDSKNRTFVNEEPIEPHEARALAVGDTLRMGTTTLRVAEIEG